MKYSKAMASKPTRRQRGAEVRGWVGPGSVPVRARDQRDIRDGTWSGMRRPFPAHLRTARARVGSWPVGAQVLLVVVIIVGMVGSAGAVAYALRDRSAEIEPTGIIAQRCLRTESGVRYAGRISAAHVDRYMDVETIDYLRLAVEVIDDGVVVGHASFDVEPTDDAWNDISVEYVVPAGGESAIPRCTVQMTAHR